MVRPPIDLRALERAQHVGHRQRRQVGGIERRLQRLVERHLGPVGERRELRGQEQGDGQQDHAQAHHRREHRGPLTQVTPPVVCREDLRAEYGSQHEAQQQGFVVAAERQHRRNHAEDGRRGNGPALQRDLHEQERDGKQPIADDDAAVLKPARGGAAEHEDDRGKDGRRQRPARTPAERPKGQPAEAQVRVDDEIEGPYRRSGIEQGPQHERWRENQRLRIGDAWMSTVVVRVPERQMPAMDGGGKEAEEGIELVLGVPGNDRVGDEPAAGGEKPDCRHGGKDQGQAPVTFPHAGIVGITPVDWRRVRARTPLLACRRWAVAGPIHRHVPFPRRDATRWATQSQSPIERDDPCRR